MFQYQIKGCWSIWSAPCFEGKTSYSCKEEFENLGLRRLELPAIIYWDYKCMFRIIHASSSSTITLKRPPMHKQLKEDVYCKESNLTIKNNCRNIFKNYWWGNWSGHYSNIRLHDSDCEMDTISIVRIIVSTNTC